jgi:peptidoglycan/LPS O-acetylase OafA/YrhL
MVFFFFPSTCCCYGLEYSPTGADNETDVQQWAKKADLVTSFLLVVTLSVAAADAIYRYAPTVTLGTLFGGLWLQAIAPFAQLTVLVALVRDGGSSRVGILLRNSYLQWLGRVSMTIYLVHLPVLWYLTWANNHGAAINWSCDSAEDEESCWKTFSGERTLPFYLIPAVWAVTLPLAAATYYFVEEPFRKMLRYRSEMPRM